MEDTQNKTLTQVLSAWISKPHNDLSQHAFLKRYNHKRTRSLALHYFHLHQLLHIYQAFEAKIQTMLNNPIISHCINEELQNRSNKILADIQFMENKCKLPQKAHQLRQQQPSVTHYVNRIMQIDSPLTLLAHYMVRILGDLNGGQRLRKQTISIYQKQNVLPNDGQGVQFYYFQQASPASIYDQLNELTLTEREKQQFGEQAAQAFNYHQHIFNDCETLARTYPHYLQTDAKNEPNDSNYSAYWRRGLAFFGLTTTLAAAAFGTVYRVASEPDPTNI